MSQELQVIQDCYDLSLLVLKRVQQFPRNQRYGLGRSIESRMEWILALLLRCKYSPRGEKDGILRDVNIELEVLRFQIRQAIELQAMPQQSQSAITEKLIVVGQQVGGWRKSLQPSEGDRK